MKRRTFVIGAVGVAAAAAWLKPGDRGEQYSEYFRGLNSALRAQRIGRPVLLVDRERLAANCALLNERIAPGKTYRIVAKSLPSLPLIEEVMRLTGTRKVMTFHQPFTNELAQKLPDCDILLGKPMPVDAAELFYAAHPADSAFDPSTQLQWLVDSMPRLQQYLALAQKLERKLLINLELDVGLHRGGLATLDELDLCLSLVRDNPEHLAFAGFMGYDAHVGKLPSIIESREESLRKSQDVYRSFVARLKEQFPALYHDKLTFNGAGSPTIFLHDETSPLNDLSAGSCLVKPTDFDLDVLADFQPAAFIATPIIKKLPGLNMPGPLPLGDLWAIWDVNRRVTLFVYGGNWLAKPESPAGLQRNSLYGVSSNQMMYNGSPSQQLRQDDFIFLRPTQSEAVLLQFGDLAALAADGSMQWWAPLEQGHDTLAPV